MNQYIGVILLVFILSLIASILLLVISERQVGYFERVKKYYLKYFSFFGFMNFFILSAAKYYLGYTYDNIFESFWDMKMITIIHYGSVMLVIAIVVPVILRCLFKKKTSQFIHYFDSAIFLTLFLTFVIAREINNLEYCIAYIFAAIITVCSLPFLLKEDVKYVTNMKTYKEKIIELLPFVLYWLVTIAIYIPNELYLKNSSDFTLSYWYFLGKILLGSIIVLVAVELSVAYFLSEVHAKILEVLLFIVVTVGYIQRMLLNGKMNQLDGIEQSWSSRDIIVNAIIWICFAIAILGIFLIKKKKAEKLIRIVSTYLIMIQVVSLLFLIITSDGKENKSELALTKKGLIEVGEKNNILFFVLDKFDGTIIDDILKEDSSFLNPLQDFTYYRNATSEHCPTGRSIPFLLTGTEWDEDNEEQGYTQYAYGDGNFLTLLEQQGYDIYAYTDPKFINETMVDIISNYEPGVKRVCNMGELFSLMTVCSKYQTAPFFFKNYYQYDTSDIMNLSKDGMVYNINNDYIFYSGLIEEGLSISKNTEAAGTFKFIHMNGAHPPFNLTEDFRYIKYEKSRTFFMGEKISQAKGSLKIVYEYIRQLKALGQYEDSTIIITADHGYTDDLSNESGVVVGTSFPILFVKEPAESRNAIRVSEAPVCHADIIPTIKEIIGYENDKKIISDYKEHEDRVRVMTRHVNDAFWRYEINGNVRDLKSWKLLQEK